jgi:methyl-accepting chemotaxis protein
VSAVDLAAVIVSIASVVGMVLLAVGLVTLRRTLVVLRDGIDELRRETVPVVADLQASVDHVNRQLERIDEVVASVRSVSGTVDAASRLAYVTLANPVIKAVALGAGTAKAARSLRQRD